MCQWLSNINSIFEDSDFHICWGEEEEVNLQEQKFECDTLIEKYKLTAGCGGRQGCSIKAKGSG